MSTAVARPEVAPISRMLWSQTRSVLLVYWRMPYFTIFSMVLPIMFFSLFGLPNIHKTIAPGVTVGAYILASMAAYGMSNVLVYNIGIGQANQRARKLDLLQRATPLPASVAIVANLVGGLALAVVSLLGVLAIAAIGGVHLEAQRWVLLPLAVIFGSMPMLGFGLILGYGSGPNAAPALASLIYLPMAFASGLFIPLNQMPAFVQAIGHYLPLYHLGQLAWNTVGTSDEPVWQAAVWIAGWSAVLFGVAVRTYRLDQQRKFS